MNEIRKAMAEIMGEVSSNPELLKKVSKLMAMLEDNDTNATKYVACVPMTTENGDRHYQPLVGNCMMPSSRDDFKMVVSDNLLEIQESTRVTSSMLKQMGYDLMYVPVSEEQLEVLQQKLDELVNDVFTAVETSINAINTVGISAPVEAAQILQLMFNNVVIAKTGLSEDGSLVERPEEGYVEELDEDEDYDNGCDDCYCYRDGECACGYDCDGCEEE